MADMEDKVKHATYAPIYAALYPELACIARAHGYALAVHGTLARDMDLICVPWAEFPSHPDHVVDDICNTFALRQVGEPNIARHGRERRTLSIAHGEGFIDLSFMPRVLSDSLNPDDLFPRKGMPAAGYRDGQIRKFSPLHQRITMPTVDLVCHCGKDMRGPRTKKDCSDSCKRNRLKQARDRKKA